MLKIALTFHSTRNDNLGVGALTVSEIAILRELARERGLDLRIIVLDSRDPRAPYVSGDDIDMREVRELRQPGTIYRVFREADMVVDIGGGDSFSDIYGGRRLFRLLLLKFLALTARRPLVLAPQTVGPFSSGLWRRLSALAIRGATIMATRDAMSTDCLREMGLTREVIEASDVALKLPYDAPAGRPADGPVRVGINVSGLLMNGGYSGANMFGLQMDYAGLIRSLVQRFLREDGVELHLVPHVISHQRGAIEDDYQASLDLAAGFPGVIVAPDFASPSEAKSYIAGLDFFMGARMHACIAAFSTGVPVVPMAYSRKFAGLFGSLGYDRTVDCTTESAEAIEAKIFDAFAARKQLAGDVAAARAKGLEKLARYEAALGDLMSRAAARRG